MHTYRAPSEILWINEGYQEAMAATADEALAIFRGRGMALTLANLQIKTGESWRFASELAVHFGGYNRRAG